MTTAHGSPLPPRCLRFIERIRRGPCLGVTYVDTLLPGTAQPVGGPQGRGSLDDLGERDNFAQKIERSQSNQDNDRAGTFGSEDQA